MSLCVHVCAYVRMQRSSDPLLYVSLSAVVVVSVH